MQRLERHNFPYEHQHFAYEDAGHCSLDACYDYTPLAGDKAAVEDMRRQFFVFLERHLRPTPGVSLRGNPSGPTRPISAAVAERIP